MQINLLKKTVLFVLGFGVFLYFIKLSNEAHLESTILFTIGSLFIFLGLRLQKDNDDVIKHGIKTKAQVVNFIKDFYVTRKGRMEICYYPIIKFKNKNQIEITKKLEYHISQEYMNQFIKIIYLKRGDHYEITVDKKNKSFTFYHIFYIVGILFISIAFFIYL
ncbi:hypothetical protein [Aurantibacter aestuarii]|uniref:DUF3592 domain-containing protein n=1 Tax=Aurantibacter aestuarii TaxID=1266046 RepID=A0A2T1N8N4_9FLAO|nr:hypothetical protein [Aurantibacter aestuarii]PSG88226.1 hypothetical protein C7H52_07930 [Aurantibacter aestuarii]